MHKILQIHLLCAFVANLKIDALYPESFCDKNLAIRKVFAFCDSAVHLLTFYSVLVFLICPLFDCLLCLFPNLHSFSYFVHFLTFYSVPVLERQGADVGHG